MRKRRKISADTKSIAFITEDQQVRLDRLIEDRLNLQKYLTGFKSTVISAITLPLLTHYLVLNANTPFHIIFNKIKYYFFYSRVIETILQGVYANHLSVQGNYVKLVRNITMCSANMRKMDPASEQCFSSDFFKNTDVFVENRLIDDFSNIGVSGLNMTCLAPFFDKHIPIRSSIQNVKNLFCNALFILSRIAFINRPELKKFLAIQSGDPFLPLPAGTPSYIVQNKFSVNMSFVELAKLLTVAFSGYMEYASDPILVEKTVSGLIDILGDLYTTFWMKVGFGALGFLTNSLIINPLILRSQNYFSPKIQHKLSNGLLTRTEADLEIKKIKLEIKFLKIQSNLFKNFTRIFSLIFLALILFSTTFQKFPELGIIISSILGVALKDLLIDCKATYETCVLKSRLNKMEKSLCAITDLNIQSCDIVLGDTLTNSYLILSIQKHPQFKKPSNSTQLTISALSACGAHIIGHSSQTIYIAGDRNIDFTRLTAHLPALINRELSINEFQQQVIKLGSKINSDREVLFQTRRDPTHLPILVCTLLIPKMNENDLQKIKAVFNKGAVEYDSSRLKIIGYQPADDFSLSEFKTIHSVQEEKHADSHPEPEQKNETRIVSWFRWPAHIPRWNFPTLTENKHSQPLKITWPSATYNSSVNGPVKPVESPYLPKNTHFTLFNIRLEDCYQDEKAYNKMKDVVEKARLAGHTGEQGLVFDNTPQRDPQTREYYISSMKGKVLGMFGNWRAYSRAETSATHQVLHVFSSVNSSAH